MEKTKTTDITIEQAVDQIMMATAKQINSLAENTDRVLLGVKSGMVKSKTSRIKENFTTANALLDRYTSFFKGKENTLETFLGEISNLFPLTEKQVDHELRERFIDNNNIQIPNFPRFKKSSYVDLIEYTEEEKLAFKELNDLLQELHGADIKYFTLDNFNTKAGEFQFSKELEDALIEEHTIVAKAHQSATFIALGFIVQGINELLDNKDTSADMAYRYDSAVQSRELDRILNYIKSFLTFDSNGVVIDSQKLKLKFGFNEAIAKIAINVRKKSKNESDERDEEKPTSSVDNSPLKDLEDIPAVLV